MLDAVALGQALEGDALYVAEGFVSFMQERCLDSTGAQLKRHQHTRVAAVA